MCLYYEVRQEPVFEVLSWVEERTWSGDRCVIDQNTPLRVHVPFIFFVRAVG